MLTHKTKFNAVSTSDVHGQANFTNVAMKVRKIVLFNENSVGKSLCVTLYYKHYRHRGKAVHDKKNMTFNFITIVETVGLEHP